MGLEVHAELSTKTKIFCGCTTAFGGEPNTHVCPGCAGMPGTLPKFNGEVLEYAVKLGLVLGCSIAKTCRFDRKNYFYPDLPKAYQVSQLHAPICTNGGLEIITESGESKFIRLHQIHMEEDAGKLVHQARCTQLDYNRGCTPLLEIVSEPDFSTAQEVIAYLEKLRETLMYLDICDCKMQEGSLRADVNLSVRPVGSKTLGTRTEMKNINSFRAIARAIAFESERHIEVLESGGALFQETRRWDEQKEESVAMRTKEDAADYRYFPDGNLAPLVVSDEWINEIRAALPELPIPKFERYKSLHVPEAESRMLIEQIDKSRFFEECIALGANPKNTAIWIMGHITSRLNKIGAKIADAPLTPQSLFEILLLIEQKKISIDSGKLIVDEIFENGGTPSSIVEKLSLAQNSDENELKNLVTQVLADNAKSIEDYKNGKQNAFTFLVGQCMKASKGKANAQIVNSLIREALEG
jgi:aspartyl-tRNA(Asn)/glutamyl-tRNA(Gln) amidotransferase subunit B